MDWLTPLLVFSGVVVSGLVTYFIARRNTSGSINTSQAAELWAESNKLRAEYKERAEKLEARLEAVNTQLTEVVGELGKLRTKDGINEVRISELERIIKELRAENQRLLALKRDI